MTRNTFAYILALLLATLWTCAAWRTATASPATAMEIKPVVNKNGTPIPGYEIAVKIADGPCGILTCTNVPTPVDTRTQIPTITPIVEQVVAIPPTATLTISPTFTPTPTFTHTMTGSPYGWNATTTWTVTPTMTKTNTLTPMPQGPTYLNGTSTPLVSGQSVREADPIANVKAIKMAYPEAPVVQLATPTLTPTWVPSMSPSPTPQGTRIYVANFTIPTAVSGAYSNPITLPMNYLNHSFQMFSNGVNSGTVTFYPNSPDSTYGLGAGGGSLVYGSFGVTIRPSNVFSMYLVMTCTPAPTITIYSQHWNNPQ